MRVLVVKPHLVVEDGVEADVLEAGGLLDRAQVAAVTLAQGEDGAAGAEHPLPEMGKGCEGARASMAMVSVLRWDAAA